jgi:hypothetical protein
MSGPVDEHFRRVVLPALRDYWAAEADFTRVTRDGVGDAQGVREKAMRRARSAAMELHHLCYVALKAADPTLRTFAREGARRN